MRPRNLLLLLAAAMGGVTGAHMASAKGPQGVWLIDGEAAVQINDCNGLLCGRLLIKRMENRVGLHHLCFRAKERHDVDTSADLLREMGARVVRGPQAGDWAPGYYYVLFEDPDNIRLEICHVPGWGVLTNGAAFNPASDF